VASTPAAQPDYGPSLPQLAWPRIRALGLAARLALAALVAAVILAGAVLVIRHDAATSSYNQTEADATARRLPPIAFHFDHSTKLEITKPPGDYVQAERHPGGKLAARMTVSPFRFHPEPGLVSGYLPIVATKLERASAHRYLGVRLQFEGRARVNEVEGYQYAFTARVKPKGRPAHQLFGRVVMLPEPYDLSDPGKPYPPGQVPSRGVLITMLSTTLDAPDAPMRVGDEGSLQRPFRSFRFGSS
jgi:hypothetical protein